MTSKKVSRRSIPLVSQPAFTYFTVVRTSTPPLSQSVLDERDIPRTRRAPANALMEWENEGGASGKKSPLRLLSRLRNDKRYLAWLADIEKRL